MSGEIGMLQEMARREELAAIKDRVVTVNRRLIDYGLDHEQIIEFWNECTREVLNAELIERTQD